MKVCTVSVMLLAIIFTNVDGLSQQVLQYDQQGRLTSDPIEEIVAIEWNNMNKITKIIRTSSSNKPDLEFSYDALGNRIRKLVKPRAQGAVLSADKWEYYYYQNKNDDAMLAVYHSSFQKKSSSNYVQVFSKHYQQLISESQLGVENGEERDKVVRSFKAQISAEGNFQNVEENGLLISSLAAVPSSTRSLKMYELANHERNVNAGISDRKISMDGNQSRAEVSSVADHYPFGMKMPLRYNDAVTERYPFGFGGKEKQTEINSAGNVYNYGARIYDARLARWSSIDKLYEEYPSVSPYAYGLNSPIGMIDTDGNEVTKSALFESTYGKYHAILSQTEGYNTILKDYRKNKAHQNGKGRRYELDVNNEEVNAVNKNFFGFNKPDYIGRKFIKSRSVFKEPEVKVTTHESHGLTFTTTSKSYSEIFVAYSLVHEAVHALEDVQAAPNILTADDKNSHERFNKNRSLIIKTLREYAYAADLYVTQSQLEDLAWHGTDQSPQFKKHFEAEAKKNNSTYEKEVEKWKGRLYKMTYEQHHDVTPTSQHNKDAK